MNLYSGCSVVQNVVRGGAGTVFPPLCFCLCCFYRQSTCLPPLLLPGHRWHWPGPHGPFPLSRLLDLLGSPHSTRSFIPLPLPTIHSVALFRVNLHSTPSRTRQTLLLYGFVFPSLASVSPYVQCWKGWHPEGLRSWQPGHPFLFFKKRFYLSFREGKGGRKRGRGTSMYGCLSCAPYRGPGLQPRHVP